MSNHYKHITLEGVQHIEDQNGNRFAWDGTEFEGTISEEEIEKFDAIDSGNGTITRIESDSIDYFKTNGIEVFKVANLKPEASHPVDVQLFNDDLKDWMHWKPTGKFLTKRQIDEENLKGECIYKFRISCFEQASRPKEVEQPVNTTDRHVCCGLISTPENIKKHVLDEPYNPPSNKGQKCHELCGFDCQPVDNPNYIEVEQPVQQEEKQFYCSNISGGTEPKCDSQCHTCKKAVQYRQNETQLLLASKFIKDIQPSTPIVEEQIVCSINCKCESGEDCGGESALNLIDLVEQQDRIAEIVEFVKSNLNTREEEVINIISDKYRITPIKNESKI